MKILMIVTMIVAMASANRCAEEDEEGWEADAKEAGYEVQDAATRKAVEDWDKFLDQADAVVFAASVKIAKANDKVENVKGKEKAKLRSAVIKAGGRMEQLSDMLLTAKKIEPDNYKFDDYTLQKIESFKQEFKTEQNKLDEALKELEVK